MLLKDISPNSSDEKPSDEAAPKNPVADAKQNADKLHRVSRVDGTQTQRRPRSLPSNLHLIPPASAQPERPRPDDSVPPKESGGVAGKQPVQPVAEDVPSKARGGVFGVKRARDRLLISFPRFGSPRPQSKPLDAVKAAAVRINTPRTSRSKASLLKYASSPLRIVSTRLDFSSSSSSDTDDAQRSSNPSGSTSSHNAPAPPKNTAVEKSSDTNNKKSARISVLSLPSSKQQQQQQQIQPQEQQQQQQIQQIQQIQQEQQEYSSKKLPSHPLGIINGKSGKRIRVYTREQASPHTPLRKGRQSFIDFSSEVPPPSATPSHHSLFRPELELTPHDLAAAGLSCSGSSAVAAVIDAKVKQTNGAEGGLTYAALRRARVPRRAVHRPIR